MGEAAQDTDDLTPVMCVHGWGGSFTDTWERNGFTALLADAGREVIGVDLLGHGQAPKPHEPEAYADLTTRVVSSLPDSPVDAIGFSMGALTLLRTAVEHPGAFRRLVLAGIGRNVFEFDEDRSAAIARAVSGDIDDEDNLSRLFAQYAARPGNDPTALAAVLHQPQRVRLDEAALASVAGTDDYAQRETGFYRLLDSIDPERREFPAPRTIAMGPGSPAAWLLLEWLPAAVGPAEEVLSQEHVFELQ
ncbi:MAG: alpha/beta fold hydrolase, partial [Ilumatobacteraceae bacterium]